MTTSSLYMKIRTVTQLISADGNVLNFSIGDNPKFIETQLAKYPGSYLKDHTYEIEVAPYEKVLIDSGIPESAWPLLCADMQRFLNMSADAGRPSDAMRSAVRAYKNGTLTEESFAASKPSGYYPDDIR